MLLIGEVTITMMEKVEYKRKRLERGKWREYCWKNWNECFGRRGG